MTADVPCPQCGGAMAPTGADSATLIETTAEHNQANAATASKHARVTRAKDAELGLIHRCTACGYQMRYKPAPEPAPAAAPASF